ASAPALRMTFEGANLAAQKIDGDQLPGRVNYFLGNDPQKWRTNIPTYGRVKYRDIYPGVDVAYYGNEQSLEYDLILHPGVDSRLITLNFDGADKLEITSEGDLVIQTATGSVRKHKPVAYQALNGDRRAIAAGYTLLADHRVGFFV